MKNLRLTPDFFRLHALPKAGGYFAALFLGLGSGMGFIQKSLGHGSSKTTEIYTHVSKKSLANIKSPLDAIIESQKPLNQHIKTEKDK